MHKNMRHTIVIHKNMAKLCIYSLLGCLTSLDILVKAIFIAHLVHKPVRRHKSDPRSKVDLVDFTVEIRQLLKAARRKLGIDVCKVSMPILRQLHSHNLRGERD